MVDALPRREEVERGKSRWQPGAKPPGAFAALAEGLLFLRRLTAEGWDYVLPAFDPDDDPEGRNASFDWLGDDNTGAALPQLVRTLPLAVSAGGALSVQRWAVTMKKEEARTPADKEEADKVKGVAAAAGVADLEAVAADIEQARTELTGLLSVLTDRLGPAAPGMGGLKAALTECLELARYQIKQKGGGAVAPVEPKDGPGTGPGPGPPPAGSSGPTSCANRNA